MAIDKTDFIILIVGDIDNISSDGIDLPQIDNFHLCRIKELNQVFLARLKPDLILSSLITKQFDIVDLMEVLNSINDNGQVRAISTALPDTQLIISEIKSAYPLIDFDLMEMPKMRGV